MKKKLSLFLAAILCFLSFSGVMAADTDVQEDVRQEETVAVEKTWDELGLAAKTAFELGVIKRDYSDNLALSGIVTRADFAGIVYGIINYKNGNGTFAANAQYFDDVGIYHYSASEIERLTEYGIISGYGDNTFRPEDEITVAEAAIMLMNAAGYQMFIEKSGSDIMTLARGKGLFKDSSLYAAKLLTREDAAVMLGNFLYINTVTDDGANISANGDIVLYRYLGLEYTDGVINAANGISLYDDEPSEKSIIISGAEYRISGDGNYEDYVGMYARSFIDNENEVVAVIPNKNKVLVINAKDLDDYDDNEYTYYVNDRKKTARVSKQKDILLNGLYCSDLTELLPVCGQVTLIDNDNNSVYDVIRVDSYRTYMVDAVLTSDESIVMKNTDSTGTKIVYELDDWDEYFVFSADGFETSLSAVKENTVVSIAEAGSKRIKIYVSANKVQGSVTELDFSENLLIADDTEYYVIDDPYMGSWDGSVGQAVVMYFDKFGNVAGFETVRTGEWRFAYILRTYIDSEADALFIKILDQGGEVSTIRCDDKLMVDSVTYKDHNRAYDVIKEAYVDFAESKPGQETTTEDEEKTYERMSTRLMRYYMSKEGNIKKIDTPVFKSVYESSRGQVDIADCLQIAAKGMLHYSNTFSAMLRVPYAKRSEIAGEVMTDSETIVFVVPTKEEKLRDDDAIGAYKSLKEAGLSNDEYYGASGYIVSGGDIVCDAVVVSMPEGSSSSEYDVAIFDKANVMLDEDDEVTYMLYGLFDNAYTSIELSDRNTYNVSSLKRGDVIFYTLSEGKVKIEQLAFRMSDNTGTLANNPRYITISGADHYFAKGRVILTRISRMQDGVAILQYPGNAYVQEFMTGLSSAKMCEPDMGSEGFTSVNAKQMKTYETYGESADWLIINQKDGWVKDTYILRP